MSQLTEGRSMGSYCAEKLHWKEMWGTDGEKSFSQTWVFLNAKLNLPWDSGCRRLCLSRTDGFTWSVCVWGGGPYETLFHCRCICYLIIALDRDFGVTDLHCATLSKISQVTVALSIRMEEKKKSHVDSYCWSLQLDKSLMLSTFFFQILHRVRLWENHTWWWNTSLVYCNKTYSARMFCACLYTADLNTWY